jgi:signal transduction histidine kinase
VSFDPMPDGIALVCDPQGTIQNILLDNLDLKGLSMGQPLEAWVDAGSLIKFFNFLVELRGRGAAFNWEINFQRHEHLVTLLITGMLDTAGLMIVGARTQHDTLALCDAFAIIGPDRAAAFRALVQDHLRSSIEPSEVDRSVYDEITRLNNELIALQRELVKKNAELEQRVEERTAQLRATNQELEAFSYSISHELRSPLRGIDGWSLALVEDYYAQLDEAGRQTIDHIRAESQHMAQLIDDLLLLSGVSRAEMRWVPVDLSARVQSIALRMQAENPARPVELVVQPGLTAVGDPDLVEMLLANLLSNAFKFTGKTSQPRIEFGQTPGDGNPVYFVRDNGVGFNMAYARNLFGAFQSMHKQSDFPGIGCGLAIAQRIINRHEGKIWADASVDHGATFYFMLLEKK